MSCGFINIKWFKFQLISLHFIKTFFVTHSTHKSAVFCNICNSYLFWHHWIWQITTVYIYTDTNILCWISCTKSPERLWFNFHFNLNFISQIHFFSTERYQGQWHNLKMSSNHKSDFDEVVGHEPSLHWWSWVNHQKAEQRALWLAPGLTGCQQERWNTRYDLETELWSGRCNLNFLWGNLMFPHDRGRKRSSFCCLFCLLSYTATPLMGPKEMVTNSNSYWQPRCFICLVIYMFWMLHHLFTEVTNRSPYCHSPDQDYLREDRHLTEDSYLCRYNPVRDGLETGAQDSGSDWL